MTEIARLRLRGDGSGVMLLQLSLAQSTLHWASELRLEADGLRSWTAADAGEYEDGSLASLFLIVCLDPPAEEVELRLGKGPASVKDHTETRLEHGSLALDLLGFAPALRIENRILAEMNSELRLDGRRIAFDRGYRKILHLGGQGEGLRQCGVIKIPGETAPGSYLYDFIRLPGLPCLFARCLLQYPQTGGRVRWDAVSPFRWELKGGGALSLPGGLAGKNERGYLLLAGCTPLSGETREENGTLLLDALRREGAPCSGAREQGLIALFAGVGDPAEDMALAASLCRAPEVLACEGAARPFDGQNYRPGRASAEDAQPKSVSFGSRLRSLLRRG